MRLLPYPLDLQRRDGAFDLSLPWMVVAEGDRTKTLAAAWKFAGQISLALGRDIGVRASSGYAETARQIVFRDDPARDCGPEGYTLDVEDDEIVLRATTGEGLLHAARTLSQLVPLTHGGDIIPRIDCLRIVDRPRFSWRGMHLDVARHFFPKKNIERWIDLLALHKFNVFHWHLTDDHGWRVPIDRYPRLTAIGGTRRADGGVYSGAYSKTEIHDLVDYARRKGITIVPEIEMPGHVLAALAAYPELSCTGGPFEPATTWGIFDDVLCAGNDRVFEFLEGVLDEVMDLFPSQWIHVGGDECPKTRWLKCPKCLERMRSEGLSTPEELQAWFTGRISKFLATRGRRLMGWDEILEGGLAPGAGVMSWRGTAGGIAAARAGRDVVMSPTTHCYFDYKQRPDPEEPGAIGMTPLAKTYSFEPIPDELDDQAARHILGCQGNVWTERMQEWTRVEYMSIPRMCALSEVAWSPASRADVNDFQVRLDGHLNWLRRLGFHHGPASL